jgi:hypothetical protein
MLLLVNQHHGQLLFVLERSSVDSGVVLSDDRGSER